MSDWIEIRDRNRLWCKIDPERCLVEIVHRRLRKYVDLRAYGFVYVGPAALDREDALPADRSALAGPEASDPSRPAQDTASGQTIPPE